MKFRTDGMKYAQRWEEDNDNTVEENGECALEECSLPGQKKRGNMPKKCGKKEQCCKVMRRKHANANIGIFCSLQYSCWILQLILNLMNFKQENSRIFVASVMGSDIFSI